MDENHYNISVIGAGPAGLSVAYHLTEEKLYPTVYEASQSVGGLAGYVTLWGKKYDIGPHIFLESCNKDAVNLWKELGGDDMQYLKLKRGMIINKQLMPFPPKPLGILKGLGLKQVMKAAYDLTVSRSKKFSTPLNAGEFFEQKFGKGFCLSVFNPFCEKYMGISASDVDLNFATSLTSFVKDDENPAKKPDKEKLNSLLYPRQGTYSIWNRMADGVRKGGSIEFAKKLQKVVTEDKRIKTLCFDDGTVIHPDMVVSSLPINVFLKLLDNCPDFILGQTSKISTRSTVLVYLKLNKTTFPYQYVTVFDHSLKVGRITNFASWHENGGELVLCLEYWCSQSDEIWKSDNESIIALAIMEIENAKIIERGSVVGSEVFRIPSSHPILSVDHLEALTAINQYLGKFENLILLGRHATFKWDGQADNIVSGIREAKRIKEILK